MCLAKLALRQARIVWSPYNSNPTGTWQCSLLRALMKTMCAGARLPCTSWRLGLARPHLQANCTRSLYWLLTARKLTEEEEVKMMVWWRVTPTRRSLRCNRFLQRLWCWSMWRSSSPNWERTDVRSVSRFSSRRPTLTYFQEIDMLRSSERKISASTTATSLLHIGTYTNIVRIWKFTRGTVPGVDESWEHYASGRACAVGHATQRHPMNRPTRIISPIIRTQTETLRHAPGS